MQELQREERRCRWRFLGSGNRRELDGNQRFLAPTRSLRERSGGDRGDDPESHARPRSARGRGTRLAADRAVAPPRAWGTRWRKASIPCRNASRDGDRCRLGSVRRVVDVEQPRGVDLLAPVASRSSRRASARSVPRTRYWRRIVSHRSRSSQRPDDERLPLRAGAADEEADPLGSDVAEDDRAHARRVGAEPGRRSQGRRGPSSGHSPSGLAPGRRRRARWDRRAARSRVGIVAGAPGRHRSGTSRSGGGLTGSGTVSKEKHVTELRRLPRVAGWFWPPATARPLGLAAALALAGCVGLLVLSPRRRPTSRRSSFPPASRSTTSPSDLGNARFLTLDPRGTLLVSVPRAGRVIALPDDNGDGQADARVPVVEGLDLPHGLAFLDGQLYVAETGRVVRFDYDPARAPRPRRADRRRAGPPGRAASHWTRTIAIGPDRRLYVSAGSTCNSCEERDPRRAAIYRYELDGRIGRAVRDGAPQRGRDRVPPWHLRALGHRQRPRLARRRPALASTSLGSRRAASTAGRTATGRRPGRCPTPISAAGDRCKTARRPSFLYQAHTAPLGLAFYTGAQFPAEYRGDLFVALHGSWNRAVPVGYKVIRVKLGGAQRRSRRTSRRGWLVGGTILGPAGGSRRGARRRALPVRRQPGRGVPDHLPGPLTAQVARHGQRLRAVDHLVPLTAA